LWSENFDDINTTITCYWNKFPGIKHYSLYLIKEMEDLKNPPECVKSVKCDEQNCMGSIPLMSSDSKCSLFLEHDSTLNHMVVVQPDGASELCPTIIEYEPYKFVDQKPPDIALTRLNATKVRVKIELPKCTAEGWKDGKVLHFWYFVTYWKSTQTETEGNTLDAEGKHNATVDVNLEEASLYNIQVSYSNYMHHLDRVLYSKYARTQYMTAPVTSVDVKPFRPIVNATCSNSTADRGQMLLLSWKKSGLIEEYLVSLNITNNLLKWEAIETKTNDNYVTVDNYIAGQLT